MGANDAQAMKAITEAEAYEGPSLIIAYAHCIEHGIDMKKGLDQQKLAVDSGMWPLYRFNPERSDQGKPALQLDSKTPSIPVTEYIYSENRYRVLVSQYEDRAEELLALLEADVKHQRESLEQLAAK
jgi:pyruvate-ferredoxin/flavodoxin oxidoreductase